jgi:hypothetical protein
MKKLVIRSFFASIVIVNFSGCAYLTNYTRSLSLDSNSYALDVKQRVVFSQDRPLENGSFQHHAAAPGSAGVSSKNWRVICAEPSPDALTVLGSSAAVTGNSGKADASLKASFGISENGAFVGLRTTSIQLLRDAMYRLCEGYASGAVSAETYQSLQRRFQSTMMGLIAIEQLTGPVMASNAILMTSVSAQAGVSSGESTVVAAQTQLNEEKQKLLNAELEKNAKAKTLDSATADVARLTKNLADAGTAKADAGVIDGLKSQLNAAIAAKDAASTEFIKAEKYRDLQAENVKSASKNLDEAKSGVTLNAAGNGRFQAAADAVSRSNAEMVNGVFNIVGAINKSYLLDSCFGLYGRLLSSQGSDALRELMSYRDINSKNDISPLVLMKTMSLMCQKITENE